MLRNRVARLVARKPRALRGPQKLRRVLKKGPHVCLNPGARTVAQRPVRYVFSGQDRLTLQYLSSHVNHNCMVFLSNVC